MQSGDGLLSQPALVINQKMKLFELRNEFAILDGNGERIGSVTQVNQSLLTKLLRIFSDADVMLPVTLEVSDAAGTPVLHIHKAVVSHHCQGEQARRPTHRRRREADKTG
jgi:uncharacterized protein YxjI